MAVFSDPWATQPTDWLLLQNGPLHHYFDDELERDLASLREARYLVDEFQCASWKSQTDFHEAVQTQLRFPSYYGRNLDAFSDCMTDLDVPDESGRVFVFRHYDAFAARERRVAADILDCLARSAWYQLLFGHRLLTFVHTEQSEITFDHAARFPVVRHFRWPAPAAHNQT